MLLRSLVFCIASFTSLSYAEESCRPAMAEAIERAQNKCLSFGCKTDVSRTAAIIAEHPEFTAGQVLENSRTFYRPINIDAAVALLSELGMIEVRAR